MNYFKLDLDKFDYMTFYEDAIGEHLEFLEYDHTAIMPKTKEENMFYLLTILTILYKEYIYNEYFRHILKNLTGTEMNNNEELKIIKKMNNLIKQKNIKECRIYLKKHKEIIKKYLERYYDRKQLNYILARKPMDLLRHNEKNIISLNPYTINQCLKQDKHPLKEEERIIGDIIDFTSLASKLTEDNDQALVLIITKELMIQNYSEEKLRRSILFIIGNVYQETIQNEKDPNYYAIKEMMENNDKYTTEQILETFILNNDFSNSLLSSFIYYTTYIKEGRLEELKNHPSYKYVKKRK